MDTRLFVCLVQHIVFYCLVWSCLVLKGQIWGPNRDVHNHETWGSVDLNVPYGRLDIRKFNSQISGAGLWNPLPGNVKVTKYLMSFKQQLNYLLYKNLGIEYVLFLNTMLVFSLLQSVCLYFVCYSLHRDQWYGAVFLCTLSTCFVTKRSFWVDKYVMYFVVTNKSSWVSITVWMW